MLKLFKQYIGVVFCSLQSCHYIDIVKMDVISWATQQTNATY